VDSRRAWAIVNGVGYALRDLRGFRSRPALAGDRPAQRLARLGREARRSDMR